MRKLFFLFVFISLSTSAQDVIVKKNGITILSKVLEVNQNEIRYKKHSNQNGPTYTISKSDIMSINYGNGEKDDFENEESNNAQSPNYLVKNADIRNSELIALYNRQYEREKLKTSNAASKAYVLIFGITPSSIISNEDVEMAFIRDKVDTPYGTHEIYYLNLKNKTNHTIYIDKGNCFRIANDGNSYCYYDITEQTTTNSGNNNGISLGLGSVAGAFGIGGFAGQLASGVNVGTGSSHSVSTTYIQNRVIAIPPNGNRNLTEEKWVQTQKGLFDKYKTVENAETFTNWWYFFDKADIRLKPGMVNNGQAKIFNENDLPWKREYIITYSKDENFRTYSTLNAKLFIHEIIGCSKKITGENSRLYIKDDDTFTISGCCVADKE